MKCEQERRLVFLGASLFSVGLFTGLYSAAALTGVLILKLPRMALSAHLNALMGGLWLLGIAYSFQFLNYGDQQKKRLSLLVIVATWSNWLITLIASFMGVNGLSYNQDSQNNIIAALLQIFVVLPSLVAALYWVRGFTYKNLSSI